MLLNQVSPLRAGYVVVFMIAAVVCFVGARRSRRIDHPDTARGLTGLLVISGCWALFQGVRLLVPNASLKVVFYLLGLVVGLASVGAWLYFCSAYAGYRYHRERTYRWLAGAVFLLVTAVKVTNPLHSQYFTTRMITDPFPHMVITVSSIHWVVAGGAYALSAIGFYLLFGLFSRTRNDTTVLGVLVSLAAAPAAMTILGHAGAGPLIQLDYEPLGVTAFAIGALYFSEDTFETVQSYGRRQVLDELDDAVVLLDDDDRLRDYNPAASDLFEPVSTGSQGETLESLLPTVAAAVDNQRMVVGAEDGADMRYFAVSDTSLSLGPHEIGRAIIFTDVTEVERQRRELARQEEQLDDFSAAITHELRNALAIVSGQLDVAEDALDRGETRQVRDRFETVEETIDRMTRVINDLSTLATHGRKVDESEHCRVESIVHDAGDLIETADLSLTVEDDAAIEADRGRLLQLFKQAVRFARANGADELRVAVTDDAIVVEGDGETIPSRQADKLFQYGESVPDAKLGGILPTVRTLASVHGWSVSPDRSYRDGIRYRIEGITVASTGQPPRSATD